MKSHPNYLRYKAELEKQQNSPFQMTFEFGSSQDERTCNKCADLNGTKMDVLEAIIGVNHPPLHEDCRCIPYYSVEEIRKK